MDLLELPRAEVSIPTCERPSLWRMNRWKLSQKNHRRARSAEETQKVVEFRLKTMGNGKDFRTVRDVYFLDMHCAGHAPETHK